MDYQETIKERLKILPNKLRSFVSDEQWRRSAEEIGKKFNFSEEKYISFENEIFLTLIGFEPKSNFIGNITKELEISIETANLIAEDVVKNIFIQVAEEIDSMWQEEVPEAKLNGVGTSFEQIILNQARAMMPARAPENLPTEPEMPIQRPIERPEAEENPHIQVPNYNGGNDPYREPTE